jgi:hypothetical protein
VRADVKLMKGGAISGTVRGPGGEPAAAIRMQLYQYDLMQSGERTLQLRTFSNSRNGSLVTDDRGAYRIYGLEAGDYYLAAQPATTLTGDATSSALLDWAQRLLATPGAAATAPPRSRAQALASEFFPGTTDPTAGDAIHVGVGQEQSGIDMNLTYVPTATVSGTVTTPSGDPPLPAQLSLLQPERPFGFSGATGFIRPATDGSFSTSGVLPGEYKLAARGAVRGSGSGAVDPTFGTASMPLWALLDVSVSGQDISGLDVKLVPGTVVSGTLMFDAATEKPPADLSKVTVALTPMQTGRVMSMAPGAARANADGTFAVTGVGPGLYRLTANLAPAGVPPNVWSARSSIVRGADSLDDPFEVRDQDIAGTTITFTDHPAQISGVILDAGGRPAQEYFIVAYAADRSFWMPQSRRVRSVRPGTTGRFTLSGLPPGDYYICALTDVENNRLSTPEFLEPLIQASLKISLAEGEKKTQDLRVAAPTAH